MRNVTRSFGSEVGLNLFGHEFQITKYMILELLAALLIIGLMMAIALTGNYGRILDTVVSADWIFFGLSAACVFRLRTSDAGAGHAAGAGASARASIPGHPYTTLAFIAASAWIVVQALVHDPRNGVIGIGLLLAGWPVYGVWRRAGKRSVG